MKFRKRSIENMMDRETETFLREHERFREVPSWLYLEARHGNGGDPTYHRGPFREDQLYLSTSELLVAYPHAGMAWMEVAAVGDRFFPVLWGALCAFPTDDASGAGHVFDGERWIPMGSRP